MKEVAERIVLVNNRNFDRVNVRQALLLYDTNSCMIGDACLLFASLRGLQAFLPNGRIDVNSRPVCKYILKNNPFVQHVTSLDWDQLDLERYDLIIAMVDREAELLNLLDRKYKPAILAGTYAPAVFHIELFKEDHVFPFFEELAAYLAAFRRANPEYGEEIFITPAEREWADRWLEANGVKETDKLLVMVDSTSDRLKQLPMHVNFEVLEYFLARGFKVLIFDEKERGKKLFYAEWWGRAPGEQMIFAEGLDLRKALCLLSSAYTRFIFGPCTGLMHCASAIYKVFMAEGMAPATVPAMVVYSGKFKNEDAWYWWRNSLVDSIIVKHNAAGGKKLLLLSATNGGNLLPCTAYTSEMIIDFIAGRYREQLNCGAPPASTSPFFYTSKV